MSGGNGADMMMDWEEKHRATDPNPCCIYKWHCDKLVYCSFFGSDCVSEKNCTVYKKKLGGS